MKLDEFVDAIERQEMPEGLAPLLEALFFAACNKWEEAHTIVQDLESADAAWIHAYLHRLEGDEMNARYWYNRAGRTACVLSSDKEWETIAMALLPRYA